MALFIGSLSPGTTAARELWDRPWIEVRSPHFLVISAIAEQRTVDLTHELENFRAAVQVVAKIGHPDEGIPTSVYVFPFARDEFGFTRIGNSRIVGYLVPRMRGNYAAIVDTSGGRIDDVLKHEYVHFLLHNRDARSYPLWFDEGFAELYQTLTTDGTSVEYGRPSRERQRALATLPWMPFETVLATRDVSDFKGSRTDMFYAQSWLLMHYLTQGRGERDLDVDLDVFLRRSEAGADASEAFEAAFNVRVSHLRNILLRYSTGKLRRRLALAHPLPEVSVTTTSVSADSIAAQLGVMLTLFGSTTEAERYWHAALALNPRNAQALVGLGDRLKAIGAFAAADDYYQRAIRLEPDNPYHHLDYGVFNLERARAASDAAAQARYLETARDQFASSYALDPHNPETLAMNGSSYMFAGEPVVRALRSLRRAHQMLPSQPGIKLLLAQAYAMTGEVQRARQLLRSIAVWGNKTASQQALELLAKLDVPDEADAVARAAAP